MRTLARIRALAAALRDMIVQFLPGPLGYTVRFRHWKKRLGSLGEGSRIEVGVEFQNPSFIHIGKDCWIDRYVTILAGPPGGGRTTHTIPNPDFPHPVGEVRIGRNVHVAPYCILSGIGGLLIGDDTGIAAHGSVYSYSHHYRNLADRSDATRYLYAPAAPADRQAMILGPVVIHPESALGLGATLLPGTTLGRGTWVACGTVVRGRHPPGRILSLDAPLRDRPIDGTSRESQP